MKNVSINKKVKVGNRSIEIEFEGAALKDNIDLDKIELLLNDFMENRSHDNMIKNVTVVRTILKDCEERRLSIDYKGNKGSELVVYKNSKLDFYEKSKYIGIYNTGVCTIKYDQFSGIRVDYINNIHIIDYSETEWLSKEFNEVMKYVYYQLNDVKAVVVDKDSKALIEIYKLFYNENPDFSSKDINIKVQTMMSILAQFGISLGDDYAFNLWGKVKMPISLSLEQLVDKLYPLGEVDTIDDSIKLTVESQKIIRIVGESIRESIVDKNELNQNLITISKVIHASRYCLSSNSDINKISHFTDRTNEEVDSSIKLVKKIKNKIDKQI